MIRKSFTFEGKRYYVKAATEKECYEKIARRKIELEEGYNRITKNTLVRDWCNEWIETYKAPSVSSSWYKTIKAVLDNIVISEIGNLKLKDVKPLHLQKLLNSKSDMSKSYIRKIYNIIHESFDIAKRNGLILDNPADALTLPAGKKKQSRRSITPIERKYILSLCEKHRAGLFLKIQLYCGLRPGEAAALKWSDINFTTKVLSVNKALKKDGSIRDPKSAAGFRKIPIPDELMITLKKEYPKDNPFGLICTNAHGEQLTETSIKRMWQSFIYNLNIEMGCKTFRRSLVPPFPVADDLVMYCLRHTYCTDLQAAGVPINVAKEFMGHADIAVTAQIYTHGSIESFDNAAMLINKLAEKRKNNDNKSEAL